MSELDKAQSIDEGALAPGWLKVLLVGPSKTGKTTAFKTFPGRKLAIGLTPRTRSALQGTPDCDLIEIFEEKTVAKRDPKSGNMNYRIVAQAWDRLWNLTNDLWSQEGTFPYSAILLDDLSTANDYAMNYVLGLKKQDGKDVATNLAGAPAEHHYVPQMHVMQKMFQSLLIPLPCHILVAGHYQLVEDKTTGELSYYPQVFGNLRTKIASWFDEVYETDRVTKNNETRYVWRTEGFGRKEFLGSTINLQNRYWTSPFEINLDESPCGFSKILGLANGKEGQQTSKPANQK